MCYSNAHSLQYQNVDGHILDINGNINTSKNAKLNVLAKHFSNLADDTTGNSQNNTKWNYIFSNRKESYYECNNIITWEKVTIALKAIPNKKSAGINTILVPGVSVPGLTTEIRGLLFTDDALVVAETSDELKSALNTTTKWANMQEMQINNSKCGVIETNIFIADNY
ncbi:hypothetical protein BB561_004620 [Smittium simulii]|uniref:Reverse transcriptase domain-containing protein n=1 Tax=Smittium simulii TaxID=133385 RepID=A0A2T9YF87_9FUNG|nr:hypothetical protein BB561_004620 [Smittium simulii]